MARPVTQERVRVKDVIVLRNYYERDEAARDRFCRLLAEHTGCLVITLEGRAKLETLSDDEMRVAGWMRIPEGQQ